MHIIGGTIEGMNDVKELTPIHGTITSLAKNTETTVVTYTVPTAKEFYIQSVLASGKAGGNFKFYINGVYKMGGETTVYNKESKNIFGGVVGVKCVAGDVLNLTVSHKEDNIQDFEGTIAGFLNDV